MLSCSPPCSRQKAIPRKKKLVVKCSYPFWWGFCVAVSFQCRHDAMDISFICALYRREAYPCWTSRGRLQSTIIANRCLPDDTANMLGNDRSGSVMNRSLGTWCTEDLVGCGIVRVGLFSSPRKSSKRTTIVVVKGHVNGLRAVPVRVHSECLFGDAFGSQRCECGPQLQDFLQRVLRKHSHGVLLYLKGHEGRGIGLKAKVKAYALQDPPHNLSTNAANIALGYPPDLRKFGTWEQEILRDELE